ncbi:MAG: iduronate 2-sulfatase [Chthoniobacter sp.]|nr:iduronate 2-sulfatase [Chthoniobacter sp.]
MKPLVAFLALLLVAASRVVAADTMPNILLIVLDDENAFAGRTDLAPQPVTPNLDRFAKRGVTFVNAQCAAPVCNPSRCALLSGLRPSTTGIYEDAQGALPTGHLLTRTTSLPDYFRQRGYTTAGSGKIFGASFGAVVKHHIWDQTMDTGRKGRLEDPRPPKEKLPLRGLGGKHDWGAFPDSREQMADWQLAGWAAEFLSKPQPKPFFLACGIVKPHTPWYVPKEYFDLFPPDRITIPDLAPDENAGLPAGVRAKPKQIKQEAPLIARRKELVAAYLAASRYADDCVGRILDGLEKGPFRDNTVVVIFGDNGYQFGERHTWSKGQLWEGSAHVPLVMAGPGITKGQSSSRPVSLLDLYPTLLELASLPARPDLDGVSLVPLLKNPSAPWERPALTTAGFKNHALRSERWRYIRYADGSEELYDHENDALERINLAAQPEFSKLKADLQKWLPQDDAPKNPNSSNGKDSDD